MKETLDEAMLSRGDAPQCGAMYVSDRGTTRTGTFCVKGAGHSGPHRGTRKEWPNTPPAPKHDFPAKNVVCDDGTRAKILELVK